MAVSTGSTHAFSHTRSNSEMTVLVNSLSSKIRTLHVSSFICSFSVFIILKYYLFLIFFLQNFYKFPGVFASQSARQSSRNSKSSRDPPEPSPDPPLLECLKMSRRFVYKIFKLNGTKKLQNLILKIWNAHISLVEAQIFTCRMTLQPYCQQLSEMVWHLKIRPKMRAWEPIL